MKALFTSDVHLSPRPRDEYRWTLFPWLATQAKSRGVRDIFILGDLTDQKDGHNNAFINRVVDELRWLAKEIDGHVELLAGNHDYSDPDAPLLRFLRSGRVRVFCGQPERMRHEDGTELLMLPHSRRPLTAWRALDWRGVSFGLLHFTFDGAIAETGFALKSTFATSDLARGSGSALLISGDVHVPQKLGPITYCGAPHPIRFGDSFKPRVLYYDGEELRSVPRTTIQKVVLNVESLDEVRDAELSHDDQAKVVYWLPRSRFGEWDRIRSSVEELATAERWLLASVELRELDAANDRAKLKATPSETLGPAQLFERFCDAKKLDKDLMCVGRKLFNGERLTP